AALDVAVVRLRLEHAVGAGRRMMAGGRLFPGLGHGAFNLRHDRDVPGRYDVDRDELARLLDGEPAFRVAQVWDGLHRQLRTPAEMTDLPRALRERLDRDLPSSLVLRREAVSDRGTTVKWLWELTGGDRVETV